MFEKLRRKFIFIAMFSVTVVLIGVMSFINIFYYLQANQNADRVLNYLAQHDGRFPEGGLHPEYPFSEETPFETRFFTVSVDEENDVTSINMGHIAAILPSQAYFYAAKVIESGRTSGYIGSYKYLKTDTKNGCRVIFLDCQTELQSIGFLIASSLGIGCVSLVIIFILISLLSKPLIEPVVQNIKKQRQFIADASHEIKTPLAIISADTDVIEIVHGKDEWTESIKEQIIRLNDLIKSMLALSKMEGDLPKNVITEFDISQVVAERADSFRPMAVNEEKTFDVDVAPQMRFTGYKEGIDQLTSVLLNNAFKYTDEHGTICLKLFKKGKNAVMEISNTTNVMPEGDLNRLFDRFYRADSSRSRETGSYGIGLSIAQAVVNQHRGSITAKQIDENTIQFRVVLAPQRMSDTIKDMDTKKT